ncbi:hypothetical protein DKX38_015641 [Salix brachista]|uniref:Uncharacterized protein n=1 Tax=Salix brachista TaxID=2182728 RepID=A0A5N5L6F9_9ROSI|nr:hypothetical protein DKX38_015641 [Salix brachista]
MGAERRWLFTLFSSAFLSLLFLLVYSISVFSSSKQFPSIIHHGIHYPPAFAYYISGGRGEKDRILRLLLAVYHPRNRYLLHLGAEASDEERMELVGAVNAVPAIRSFGNVDVVGKPGRLTYMGSSNLAAILRAAAILLRMDAGWTWFVSLSAMDYPLITQDGHNVVRILDGEKILLTMHTSVQRSWIHIPVDWKTSARVSSHKEPSIEPGTRFMAMPRLASVLNIVRVLAGNMYPKRASLAICIVMKSCWPERLRMHQCDSPALSQLYKRTIYLSHVFSSVSRDLSFIDHTSDLGWKEPQRIQPIVVDPGIYLARRSQIFHATEKRSTPDGFKVFTGKVYSPQRSPWVILSRSFLEFCVLGWDNLPRTLLMYFNNVILSEESYFHSVICNAPEFKNTTLNSDLRYMVWDNPPKMEPHFLNTSDYDLMVQSGVAFARQFQKDDPVLDKVDEKILRRGHNRAAPGAWCTGRRTWWMDPCSQWGDVNVVKPGPQAKKLKETITNLLDEWISQANQSIYRATPLAGYDIVHGSGIVEGKQVNSLGGFSEWCTVMGADKRCESIRGPPSLRCPQHALECPFCSFSTIQKL